MPFPSTQPGLTTVDTNVDTILTNQLSRVRFLEEVITDAANYAYPHVIATVDAGTVVEIESVIVAATSAQTANLTSVEVLGGAAGVLELISTTTGARANIAATDEQVAWSGNVRLGAAATIYMNFAGTGAGATALRATVKYRVISGTGGLT